MATVFRRSGRKGRYVVKFRGLGGRWHVVAGYPDVKASEELGRKLEKLAACRATGETIPPDVADMLKHAPAKLQVKLAEFGLLDIRSVFAVKPILEHVTDYEKALADGVASPKCKARRRLHTWHWLASGYGRLSRVSGRSASTT